MTPSQESYLSIPLTHGQVTLVDAADYEWLSQWKWRAAKERAGNFYVVRYKGTASRDTKVQIYMHREILGLAKGDIRLGDHINHDTLDNRRANLRIATFGQNCANSRKQEGRSSSFKGVTWHKQAKKWQAHCAREKGGPKYLGLFASEEEAHQAYRAVMVARFGEFAFVGSH